MKTLVSIASKTNQRRRGGALLVAVLFFVFTAIFLATYLTLCRNEYSSVARSQTWNSSMVMAEAGVEDALAMINQNANGVVGTLGNWPLTATNNGWSIISGTNTPQVYYLANRSPDSSLGYYSVYITNNVSGTNGPAILSIGTGYWHSDIVSMKAPNATRKVYVQTSGYSQGSEGIIAYSTMDFKGNNVTMDSFNSGDPNHSIWQTQYFYHGTNYGLYSDSLSYVSNSFPSRTANVFVATDGLILNVGGASVYGYVDTAPGGAATVKNNGSVGDLNWVHTGSSGIENGHGRDDMNQQYFSKSLPVPTNTWQLAWTNVPTPASGTVIKVGGTWTNIAGVWTNVGGIFCTNTGSGFTITTGTGTNAVTATYTQVITNRVENTNFVYYAMLSLTKNLFVDAPNVVLYLPNGWKYNNNTFVLNTNADIAIYTKGNVDTTGGNPVIDNGANYAPAFRIYDVSGFPITLKFAGNGIGTGYIYVPSSSVEFDGGGNSGTVIGCIFCNNITINGNYTFHFDEQFDQTIAADQFLPIMWQEVP